jgi:hypothetical protein
LRKAKSGAITGLSIGYQVVDSKILPSGVRSLTEIKLLEISVVTFPANGLARINDVKSMTEANEFERVLMRHGMTLVEAKDFLSNHQNNIETKYIRAAETDVARKILLKLQGEK